MLKIPETLVVHYRVMDNADPLDPVIEYTCPTRAGIGLHRSKVLQKIKESFSSTHTFAVLREVDRLDLVRSDHELWDEINISARHLYSIKELFVCHHRLGIPIRHTVSLAFKLLGIDSAILCLEAGVHRNYLNNTLKGVHAPTPEFKALLTSKLGLDPWFYAEWLQPTVIQEFTEHFQ